MHTPFKRCKLVLELRQEIGWHRYFGLSVIHGLKLEDYIEVYDGLMPGFKDQVAGKATTWAELIEGCTHYLNDHLIELDDLEFATLEEIAGEELA